MKRWNAQCLERFGQMFSAMMVVIALSMLAVPPGFCGDTCSEIDVQAISKILRGDALSGASIVSKEPIPDLGLCEVILQTQGGQYLPCYVSRDSMILGHLYKDGQNISENRTARIRRSLFLFLKPELNSVVAFIYRPKVKKTNVFMITDPLCPYCHKAEPRIKALADQYHAQINVILHSVHGPKGDKKCVEAVCRNFALDAYQKEQWRKENSDDFQCEKGILLIEKARKLVHQTGITGVPTFILDDGRSMSGTNMEALKRLLAESPAQDQDQENTK
jgi:thiol:disulfide interchange protein DsbC